MKLLYCYEIIIMVSKIPIKIDTIENIWVIYKRKQYSDNIKHILYTFIKI